MIGGACPGVNITSHEGPMICQRTVTTFESHPRNAVGKTAGSGKQYLSTHESRKMESRRFSIGVHSCLSGGLEHVVVFHVSMYWEVQHPN